MAVQGELPSLRSDAMPALHEGEYCGVVRGSLGSTQGRGIGSVLRLLVYT